MAVVLVTGGSSGIGLAIVQRLAAAGDRVYAAARNPRRAALPKAVTPLTLDVVDPAAAAQAVTAVAENEGRLDALVNCAGVGTLGPVEETVDEVARHVFEVNVFGPMRLARAALPVMRAQGGGRIVNVTSMNDVLPAPFGGWYSASKAALASASAVLDAEVHAFGVHVTVVAPGLFRSEMSASLASYDVPDDSPYREAFRALTAQNAERIGTAADPDEVARAVEDCLRSPEPPARVVVGADAVRMDRLVRDSTAEDLGRMLRGFVAGLAPGS